VKQPLLELPSRQARICAEKSCIFKAEDIAAGLRGMQAKLRKVKKPFLPLHPLLLAFDVKIGSQIRMLMQQKVKKGKAFLHMPILGHNAPS
jgi:hypothetical protein